MIMDKENYKLYNVDCIELMKKMESESIDLIVTDIFINN